MKRQPICMSQDVRYIQRLYNYTRALLMLKEGVHIYATRELSNMEKQGLIKSFEFAYELSWKLMRDFSLFQGHHEIRGSRDAIRQALAMDQISDGETWMDMLESRNNSSHTYDEKLAEEIIHKIVTRYYPTMVEFQEKMSVIGDAG